MDTQKGLKTAFVTVVLVCVLCSAARGQYCSASGGGQQHISGVVVGSLVNTGTGSDGYADYTSMSVNIALGESQIATIINGMSITGSQCGIWVDWNADSDFDDGGETIAMSGGPASFTGTVTVPVGTIPGDKRMRVRIMGAGSLTACGDTTYGEVEDYTIAVVVPWTGSGDANDPYQIWDANDMQAIGADANYWDAHFLLCADINLAAYTGTSFNIIGIYLGGYPGEVPFTGVFDGNGHTISNFTYSSTGKMGIGLFRYVDGPSAEIKDLDLMNPNVDAGTGEFARTVGSLVGSLADGAISGCYVDGASVSGGDRHVGGLVGLSSGTITNCYFTGSVSGIRNVGGLVGNSGGTIGNCSSVGSVSGASYSVGGLVGKNGATISNSYSSASVSSTHHDGTGGLVGDNSNGEISNSYATGSVLGSDVVGGLAGMGGIITNCYSTGSVSGDNRVGGLAGMGEIITNSYSTGSVSSGGSVGGLIGSGGIVYNSFWDIETSGEPNSAGGEGKTTAEMKEASTYIGWGCGEVWTIDDGVDYPHLIWEGMPGEIIFPELSDFVGGAGTETEPYLIYTAEELNLIALFSCELDKHFKLMVNIDLAGMTGTSYNRIGVGVPFNGVFDGNGHTISNFTSTKGLFGTVAGQDAEIKDLGLIDPNVDGVSDVGSLVAVLEGARISGCYVEGGSVSGASYSVGGLVGDSNGIITDCYSTTGVSGSHNKIGGLVGVNREAGTITNCYATGSVSGTGVGAYQAVGGLAGDSGGMISNCYAVVSVSASQYRVGGLVGYHGGTMTNCYSTSSVSGSSHSVGGLVGGNVGEISNCYSLGNVQGSTKVGGLVGSAGGTISNCYAWGSASAAVGRVGGLVGEHGGTMSNCYSIGSATGPTDVGGVVGWNEGAISACLWDTQTSGLTNMCGSSQSGASGCDDDGGKTTAEMQMGSTFTDAGWDFVDESDNGIRDIWRLCNEGTEYPQLNWQYPAGDFVCPDGVDGIDVGVLCEEWLLEELSCDVWPEGGDGIVDFLDWAVLADGWGNTYDIFDLAEFAWQWLQSGSNYLVTDIAPGSDGDGITNGVDFAVLAENWLEGM